jgi:ribulose-5-phosphate 4-epimerase/fuculose-1-phosphate aldolase
MNAKEGYIKFNLRWDKRGPVIPASLLKSLNSWREIMRNLDMVGATTEGIGYGNLSARYRNTSKFYITGTATGNFTELTRNHYCLVTEYNIRQNRLSCAGPVRASAESMTHAAIYLSAPDVGAVYHIHHKALWKSMLDKVPTTPENAEFGTPEMALSLMNMLKDKEIRDERIAVMHGHEDGIIFWGRDADEAGKYVLSYYNLIV